MKSFKVFSRQARYIGSAFALLVATFLPLLTTTVASAAQVTARSIELSSSSKEATAVTYKIKFTAATAAGAVVVDFCSESPLIGEACTPPTDMSASAATSTDTIADKTASTVTFTKSIAADDEVTLELVGVVNPSEAGTMYARIVTFDTALNAESYTAASADTDPNVKDTGSVAISITNTIGVAGSVLESMTFCVAKSAINKGCNLSGNTAPSLELGETVGTVKALDAGNVSSDSIFTQISTNAVTGAVVNLKTVNTCGGLKRADVTICDIVPSTDGITAGQAEFGLKTAATSTDAPDASGAELSGALQVKGGSGYNSSTYLLNYASNASSGVTSTYGDPLLDTNGAPVNNRNMQITFGASISNDTPAGRYSADLSMVATGTF